MTIEFESVIPILRVFDITKADEFYLGYLGFKVDWDHVFDNGPLYRQVSRGGLVLHLSEHHGDGSPGIHVRVAMKGLTAYHAELQTKAYPYMRPGIEEGPVPGTEEIAVIDPFGNRITFCQDKE
ncbi:Glyoxalase/Bleomycin resistance protein/Dihydroxybiphenyl dioxygenase [Dactylonectria macrodidyma]|uniref:Bleomycin resistance protein n=1 Tax=Dactylonectria macrodidyma TaxID=307937 RepID=A0A9P9D237_9HYPO|nr:Glyoxalase/Bleomycin resistance protein/Dihydroxybiphenyl dioxygenase [Dactylonectria macrodidyma]